MIYFAIQGVPFEVFGFQMALVLNRCIINPMLIKQKCIWEVVIFSMFKNLFTFFSCLFTTFPATLKTHFGFTNIWSSMHHFHATAIQNPKVSNGTPCIACFLKFSTSRYSWTLTKRNLVSHLLSVFLSEKHNDSRPLIGGRVSPALSLKLWSSASFSSLRDEWWCNAFNEGRGCSEAVEPQCAVGP